MSAENIREEHLMIGDLVQSRFYIDAGDESVERGAVGIVVGFSLFHDFVVDFENGQSYTRLSVDVSDIEAVSS